MPDITRQDVKNLARVLYRSVTPEFERVSLLAVGFLLSQERIHVAVLDGLQCLCVGPPPPQKPIRVPSSGESEAGTVDLAPLEVSERLH
jgi:hypothetical protein